MNMSTNGRMLHMDFWAGGNNTSSPKEYPGISPVQRPDSSPATADGGGGQKTRLQLDLNLILIKSLEML